jgi:hypothetical protein
MMIVLRTRRLGVPKQLRQLGDIHRNPPGLIVVSLFGGFALVVATAAHSCRVPGLLFGFASEIDVGKPVGRMSQIGGIFVSV